MALGCPGMPACTSEHTTAAGPYRFLGEDIFLGVKRSHPQGPQTLII